jgi:glutamate carboxypeptidase
VTLTAAPGSLVTADELHRIESTVEAGLPAFLADLERLCSIDCGSYTPDGVNEVATWVAAELEAMGATVERRSDPGGRHGDTVIGTFEGRPGAGPRILLIGHMDTVFEAGTVAKRPFRITDAGAGPIARGPGVSDMKAGLLAGLRAIGALRELLGGSLDAMPFERITFIANPDEEIGSPTSTPHIVEKAQEVDAAFVLECARAWPTSASACTGARRTRASSRKRAAARSSPARSSCARFTP